MKVIVKFTRNITSNYTTIVAPGVHYKGNIGIHALLLIHQTIADEQGLV